MPILHRGIGVQNIGSTPLIAAAIRGDVEQVKALLSQGANVSEQDQYGWTALQVGAAYGYKEIVDLLLSNRADPNVTNDQGRSALMYAAAFGHCEAVEALINAGADVNAVGGPMGGTALHAALWEGFAGAIAALLQAPNIDLKLPNRSGKTPRQFAIELGRIELARLIEEAEAQECSGHQDKPPGID